MMSLLFVSALRCCNNISQIINLKRGKVYFGSQFQRVQSIIGERQLQDRAVNIMVNQNIEKKGNAGRSRFNNPTHPHRDTLPLKRPHLLIVPLLGPSIFKPPLMLKECFRAFELL